MKKNIKTANGHKDNRKWSIIAAANIFLSAVFFCVALLVGIIPTVNKFGLFQPTILIFCGAMLVATGTIIAAQYVVKSVLVKKLYPYIVSLLFLLSITVLIILGYSLQSTGYTWDSELLINAATSYAHTGIVEPGYAHYLAVYSNNMMLFTMLSSVAKLALILHIEALSALIALNIILMFVAQLLIFLCAKMLYGRRMALLSIIFSGVLIAGSLYVQTPYTDTLSIVLPILIAYLCLHLHRARKARAYVILSVILGCVAVVGYLVKPTVIIALVAIALVAVVVSLVRFKREYIKTLLPKASIVLGSIAVSMLATYSAFTLIVDSQNILPYSYTQASKYSIPFSHFVDMGMITQEVGYSVNYGGYNSQDVKGLTALATKQEQVEYSQNNIKNHLKEYGAVGYLEFLSKKLDWITSDATFFAFGEGDNSQVVFAHNDSLSKYVRTFTTPSGKHYLLYGNILQVFWLGLLLLIAVQFILNIARRSTRRNIYQLVLKVMFIGILLFLLLFEGRSRYLFLYLPIIILLAMYTPTWFGDKSKSA